MKNTIFSSITFFILSFTAIGQELAPYIKVGESNENIQQVSDKIISTLRSNSFTILGSYNPSNKSELQVIAFTRDDLKNTVVKITDKGALAATFKVGLVQKNGKVTISYTNPDYILKAYLRDNYVTFKSTFVKFIFDLKRFYPRLEMSSNHLEDSLMLIN